jgi:hypothetical protein
MGQQQLLLLVLGIVIVGLAVVVGIQAFGENQKKANADAMVNDAIRIASDAQAWNLKPQAFGGGDGSFTGASFEQLGYAVNADQDYENLNGTYTLAVAAGGEELTVTAVGANADNDNGVQARVCGTGPDDIFTAVAGAGDAAAPACP